MDDIQNTSNTRKGHHAHALKDDGSNWVSYKEDMEDYIIGYRMGYRRHLKGLEREPIAPQAKEGGKVVTVDQMDTYEEKIDNFLQIHASIRSIIRTSISE